MTSSSLKARGVVAAAVQAIETFGFDSPAATHLLDYAVLLTTAAYNDGYSVGDIHPRPAPVIRAPDSRAVMAAAAEGPGHS